jgi:hypothetical protein
MAENVIYVRGKNARAKVLAIVRRVPQMAMGKINIGEAADALMVRMGLTALMFIKQAFVIKASGGTDEAGESWVPLKKTTVAYSRRHLGVLWPGSKRAPFAPSWMLTEKQRKRWWDLYRSFGGGSPSGSAYHAIGVGGGWAAARAWAIVKAEGGKTLLGEYGNTKVQILRDTGLLLNSLSPGFIPTDQNPPVPPPKPEDQVFSFAHGEVIVGTNRKWAIAHHEVRGHNPKRRLWPEPSKWPSGWWSSILNQGRMGLIDILLTALRTL